MTPVLQKLIPYIENLIRALDAGDLEKVRIQANLALRLIQNNLPKTRKKKR